MRLPTGAMRICVAACAADAACPAANDALWATECAASAMRVPICDTRLGVEGDAAAACLPPSSPSLSLGSPRADSHPAALIGLDSEGLPGDLEDAGCAYARGSPSSGCCAV